VSVVAATISLGVICLFGIPLAYVLARSKGRCARVVGWCVQIPLAVPPLVGGILVIYLVGPYTWAGRLFRGRLTESIAGIVLAQCFVAAPFLVTVARASFAGVDPALFDVAQTLGLGPVERFIRVAIPAARRGIRAGMVLAWLRAFGEYGATVILAYHPYSLPVFTYLQFGSAGLSSTEAPTAVAIVIAAAAVVLGEVRIPLPRKAVDPLPPPSAPSPRARTPFAFSVALAVERFELALEYASTTGRLAIIGPSGSGKSLTMRALAGVVATQRNDLTVSGSSHERPPSIGYVPQSLGLFPHLRVRDQILFGRGADAGRAAYWSERLGIDGIVDRWPDGLSGGEQQRVALVRTFARAPDLLLLDEPFSSLDAPVRASLRLDLRELQRASGIPSIIVTHDPEEAAMLAEEIVVIVDGHLLQSGLTRDLFDHPASPTVARLLGAENVFEGIAVGRGRIETGGTLIESATALPEGTAVTWSIRAERAEIGSGSVRATVVDVIDRGVGSDALAEIAPGIVVRGRCRRDRPDVGDSVALDLPPDAISVWTRARTPE
jgi:molybdate transport system permease protein